MGNEDYILYCNIILTMKHLFFGLIFWAVGLTCIAQNFEGKITYKVSYTSRTAGVTSEQFSSLMGDTQEYFIKGNHYKSVFNGKLVLWGLYIPAELKMYTKMSNSETLLWNDVSLNTDEVLKVELNKSKEIILGFSCDELILTCKSGVQKFYFHASLGVDPALFVQHKYGKWYDYVSRAKALHLKSVIETPQFVMESIATDVKPMKLDDGLFTLPPGVKSMKSPY